MNNTDLIEAFELGGMTITKDEMHQMLTKVKPASREEDNVYVKPIDNQELDAFLNGFIILKRGPHLTDEAINLTTQVPVIALIEILAHQAYKREMATNG